MKLLRSHLTIIAPLLLNLTVEAPAATITFAGSDNNNPNATLTNKVVPFNADNPQGSFDGTARASAPSGQPQMPPFTQTATSGKLPTGVVTSTPVATDTYTSPPGAAVQTITSSALASWSSTASGASAVLLSTKGSYAKVAGAVFTTPICVASARIQDPFMLSGANGQTFELSYGLGAGFNLFATGTGVAVSTTDAGTSLNGLSSLFNLSITMNGAVPGAPVVLFQSPSVLGLDDTAIASMIQTALEGGYDAADNSVTLPVDLTFLTVDVTVPATTSNISLSWDTEIDAATAPIPEPMSFLLLALGLIGLRLPLTARSSRRT
jgi:hypothetical protein